MDSTKEKLLKKTYDNYINLMLYDFPIEKISEIVDFDVKGYGSTLDEKFLEIQRLRKMVIDQREQGAGIEIQFLHTPIHKRISPNEDTAIYMDEFEISMVIDGTKQLIPLRLSSIFEFGKNTWKLVHLHGSKAVETEGDTWHQNEWKKKNEELQRLVDEKTAELLIQNRELEIEAALERIRSSAMAMNKTDKLTTVIQTIFQELKNLDFDPAICSIGIYNKESKGADWWISDKSQNTLPRSYHMPYMKDPWSKSIYNAWKNQAPVHTYNISGKAKIEQDRIHFEQSDLKYLPESTKNMILSTDEFDASYVSMKHGMLEVVTEESLSENQIQVLQRLGKVIDLTYTRFEDLRLAEEQARDAEIELALERVRARTMAMQHSDELAEASFLLDSQVRALGIKTRGCAFNIYGDNESTEWFSSEMGTMPAYKTPRVNVFLRYYKEGLKGNSMFIESFAGDTCAAHYDYLCTLPIMGEALKEFKKSGGSFPTQQIDHVTYFKYGYLLFITLEPVPDAHDIFLRFAKVFEQTYTRFLDLQKAEAQAREAQIEAALERFRSRMLGMQKSSELEETTTVMYQQLKALGVVPEGSMVYIVVTDRKTDTAVQWIVSDNALFIPPEGELRTPMNEHPELIKTYEAWKRQEPLLIRDLSGDELNDLKNYFKSLPSFQKVKTELDKWPDRLVWSEASFSNGTLGLIYETQLPKTTLDILVRFSRVFDLTYTRFLDIQKAEEQAREAQIVAALERIRNRTLLMRNSSELNEAVAVFFKEFKTLDLLPPEARTYFCDINPNTETAQVWMTASDGKVMDGSHFTPLSKSATLKKYYQAWKNQVPISERIYSGKKLKDYLDFVSSLPHVKKDKDYKKLFQSPPNKIVMTDANFLQGNIGIMTFKKLSDEAITVLKRFAKVFEFTYTRFLDLQKTEAQAREAQIEVALERVRAASMAMHKSDELQEVISVVLNQMISLGIKTDVSYIVINAENTKDFNLWLATENNDYARQINLPYFKHPIHDDGLKASKKQVGLDTHSYSREEKNRYFEYQFKHSDLKYSPEERKKFILDAPGYTRSMAINKHASIAVNRYVTTQFSKEENEILIRISNVFEQAYTRFLDIKKAEAQAREAQIEAALEKVRSRSLAMHKSDELQEVVAVVFEKLMELKFDLEQGAAIILIFIKGSKDHLEWIADPTQALKCIKMPFYENPLINDISKGWEDGTDFYSRPYSFEIKNDFFKHAFEFTDYKYFPGAIKEALLKAEKYSYSIAFEKNSAIGIPDATGKILSEEKKEILKRFTKVFEQSYIRFLDLQKAEAQSREAQIEAALERIRSRAIGMQSSAELIEVANTMREQMTLLGQQQLATTAIHLYDLNQDNFESWYASVQPADKSNKLITGKTVFSKTSTLAAKEMLKMYHSEQNEYTLTWKGKKHVEWMEEIFNKMPGIKKAIGGKIPPQQISHYSEFTGGALVLVSLEEQPSEESKILQNRTAAVFDLAYRRFLDLKQAEAQAREAQIEASLERIRAKAMAMHSSEDIPGATTVVFNELSRLGLEMERCGIVIFNEPPIMEVWSTQLSPKNKQAVKIIKGNLDTRIHPLLRGVYKSWKESKDYFEYELKGKEVENYYETLKKVPDYKFPKIKEYPNRQIINSFYFDEGLIFAFTKSPLSKKEKQIFFRFTKVFASTYRRYLDIQKAEAQTREAQIEAALERVRSRSLAMHKSDELVEVVTLVFQQLKLLNIRADTTYINTELGNKKVLSLWIANESYARLIHIPYFQHTVNDSTMKAYENRTSFIANSFTIEEKNSYFEHAFKYSDLRDIPQNRKKYVLDGTSYYQSIAINRHSSIATNNYYGYELSQEENEVLIRFSKVFEQAYIRFLDLKKAEVQAREAQIEAALERVRSRSLAMHHSSELQNVVSIVFEQLQNLEFVMEGAAAFIATKGENYKGFDFWMEDKITKPIKYRLPYYEAPSIKDLYDARERSLDFIAKTYGKEKNIWFEYAFKNTDLKVVPDDRKKWILEQTYLTQAVAFRENSMIGIHIHYDKMLSKEEEDILKRFSKVFEQSYVRFLDLKKAEAQARESQIEAALEKVRSRSLAMHTANELGEVIAVIVEKLKDLDVVLDANGVILCTYFKDSKDVLHWIASPDFSFAGSYLLPYFDHPIFNDAWQSKENGDEYFSKAFSVEEKNSFFKYAFEHSDYRKFPDDFKKWVFQNDKHILSFAWQKNSAILIPSHTGVVPSANDIEILKRFARVFEQAYVRFLDLKKAEAQAREAQIEAALERVRSRSLAMKQSDELQEVISVVFIQMQNLGIKADASLINILTEDSRDFYLWIGTVGQTYAQKIRIPYIKHPVFDVFYEARDSGKNFMANALTQEEKDSFFKYAFKYSDLKLMPADRKKYVMESAGFARSFAWSKNSGITVQNYAGIPYSDQENEILKRFAKVFEQAYTRFLDVKNAEARALEATKQASLDRVRAEIASMRSKDDLNRITPLVWKELTALGIPFIRCGVLIMDESREMIHTFLSTPEGRSLTAFEMSFHEEGIASGASKHWAKNEIYTDFWDKEQFISFMQNLINQGKVDSPKSFQGAYDPPEKLYLNFVPFKQGMLYVGNISSLGNNELDLIQSLAKTFAIAFARYEDFKQLETAKNEIEKTLSELKSTQTQLIQSEKMASLGELTAGIAHEIQNPLNFVNNFSEVSVDLIEEMEEEMASGNVNEVKFIVDDLKLNLEKINNHGKRASSIIKGMLQHSRTSSGEKEITDINALADEYLRLSYHGLRAKDKSFNADFKLVLDESLPKINVIPQDIGRVLLNLINNAFYAVDKRAKEAYPLPPKGGSKDSQAEYRPTVTISTTSSKSPSGDLGVKVVVKDNGNGIPSSIVDKIFQPFFTTKPTGQGTGLGLSLSYDIVKAHSGKISVVSKENEGTEFIIQIPTN